MYISYVYIYIYTYIIHIYIYIYIYTRDPGPGALRAPFFLHGMVALSNVAQFPKEPG